MIALSGPGGLAAADSALALAARNGHLSITLDLLNAGADIEAKGQDGAETALYSAAKMGHPDVLELLMEHGADADYHIDLEDWSNTGWTPLIQAANHNKTESVRQLLSYGVNRMKTSPARETQHGRFYHHCNHYYCEGLITLPIDENWTAGDFVVHMSKHEKGDPNHQAFMKAIFDVTEENFSSARFAIESRHYRELRSGLRRGNIVFERKDRRGRNLIAAASCRAAWPGAPPVCSVTLAIAKAVEKVALVGWTPNSPWSPINHWLQPDHVKGLAKTVLLCVQRSMVSHTATPVLPVNVPAEICHIIIAYTLGRGTPKPQGMRVQPFNFRKTSPREEEPK